MNFDDQKNATAESLTSAERPSPSREQVYAHLCQRLINGVPGLLVAGTKPTVQVFRLESDGGDPAANVYAGITLHVCGARTPEHALELLARTLHQRTEELSKE